jgi:catechol 2,3-dioxygenase-like lactoylglutathione lyase family enzyme
MSTQDALHHVGFTVGDLDRSVAFYSLLLGAVPFLHRVYDEPFIAEMIGYEDAVRGCAMFRIPRSGVTLELIQYHVPPGQGAGLETYRLGNAHLCLVVDDLDSEYGRLLPHEVAFRSPPVVVPADVDDPAAGGKALYLRDPDGITVELIQLPL